MKFAQIAVLALLAVVAEGFSPAKVSVRSQKQLAVSHSKVQPAPLPSAPPLRRIPTRSAVDMSLFGLGWPELLVIGGAALIFFGPEKLTDVAKEAGKSASALKEASAAFQEGLNEAEGKKPKELEKEKDSDI